VTDGGRLNGWIWVAKHVEEINSDPDALYSNDNEDMTAATREVIARVSNCITVLSRANCGISEVSISLALEGASANKSKDIVKVEVAAGIVVYVRRHLAEREKE
jgi:hypothetical protein